MSLSTTGSLLSPAYLSIPYESADFPPGIVPHKGTLRCSWNELLWAAITIGRPNMAYVFQHGNSSIFEALFRLSIVRMAIEEVSSSTLQRTDAHRALDPTEKGAVSYFLGMAVCKLFANRLLDTPWLLHLDLFRDQFRAKNLGRSRPDLIGQDMSGRWHAFETKGRSGVPNSSDKDKAKAQAVRLISVDGVACTLHIGSFTFFQNNKMAFFWRDPEPENAEDIEPLNLRIKESSWSSYYKPALALAAEDEVGDRSPSAKQADLKVEIFPLVREFLYESQWSAARTQLFQERDLVAQSGFQKDGLRVTAGPSWRRHFITGAS